MVGLLLDTNVVSELRRRRPSNVKLFEWRETVTGSHVAISVITVFELEFGARRAMANRAPHAVHLLSWINDQVMIQFRDAILPVDVSIARRCAELQRIRTFPFADALIAATALVHDLVVVTRNVADFADTGARITNPWDNA